MSESVTEVTVVNHLHHPADFFFESCWSFSSFCYWMIWNIMHVWCYLFWILISIGCYDTPWCEEAITDTCFLATAAARMMSWCSLVCVSVGWMTRGTRNQLTATERICWLSNSISSRVCCRSWRCVSGKSSEIIQQDKSSNKKKTCHQKAAPAANSGKKEYPR